MKIRAPVGTGWTQKFPHTWQMISDGRYDDAANALDGTVWQHQTPDAFWTSRALRVLPPKPAAQAREMGNAAQRMQRSAMSVSSSSGHALPSATMR
jgi:hypothetical protein